MSDYCYIYGKVNRCINDCSECEYYYDYKQEKEDLNKQKIVELQLKGAIYKASFYGNTDLVDKLQKQKAENRNILSQTFYITNNDKYRTIQQMFYDELIDFEELEFLKELIF